MGNFGKCATRSHSSDGPGERQLYPCTARGFSSNIGIMKTLFRTHKYVLMGLLGLAVMFVFGQEPAVAARKAKSKKKVEITNDTIVIHPTVKLSPADEKAMDDILKKNSKTLYRIDTVENGKVTTNGSLNGSSLTAAVKAEMPTEGKGGKSHKTAQVICPAPCHTDQHPFSTIFKATDSVARQRLIQELKPILQKYQ
jgi:hypothetical protein